MEDRSSSKGGRKIAIDNHNNHESSQDIDDTVHPGILAKIWTSVEEDQIMVKVMHRLREKTGVVHKQQDKSQKDEEMTVGAGKEKRKKTKKKKKLQQQVPIGNNKASHAKSDFRGVKSQRADC